MSSNHLESPARAKRYFSERQGLRTGAFDLATLRKVFRSFIDELESKLYLYEWLGYDCVDGEPLGRKGGDPSAFVLKEVGRDDLWPPATYADTWSEDAIFDLVEFLAENVSAGDEASGRFHNYNECGWHYYKFTREPALAFFVTEANRILARYDRGYQLDEQLQVVALPPEGTQTLVSATLPKSVSAVNRSKVENAIRKFRSRGATESDRGDALRDLGDVLEGLKPEAKRLIRADATDIFNFLNNFGLRHNNDRQKTDYDPIWQSAMFYHLLTVIHTLTRLIDQERDSGAAGVP